MISTRLPRGPGNVVPPASTLDEGAMDRRILVVDDSELICQQLSQLLARPDRRIKVAHDGTTALEWLVESNFSLVLTDLCLPGINGLDLIREIRQRDLPVTDDRDDRARLDRLGRRGDEAGRLRLPAQADRLGPPRGPGREGARGPQAPGRGRVRCGRACSSAMRTTTCWARARGCARSSRRWRGSRRRRARS